MKMLKIILSLSLILIFSAQSFASTATESINNFAFNAAKILEYVTANISFLRTVFFQLSEWPTPEQRAILHARLKKI